MHRIVCPVLASGAAVVAWFVAGLWTAPTGKPMDIILFLTMLAAYLAVHALYVYPAAQKFFVGHSRFRIRWIMLFLLSLPPAIVAFGLGSNELASAWEKAGCMAFLILINAVIGILPLSDAKPIPVSAQPNM